MTRSGAPHDAAAGLPPPPPYEAATDGQGPHDNDDDDDDAREQRPFIAYSDEKTTQGSSSCSSESHSRASAAQDVGGSFGQRYVLAYLELSSPRCHLPPSFCDLPMPSVSK